MSYAKESPFMDLCSTLKNIPLYNMKTSTSMANNVDYIKQNALTVFFFKGSSPLIPHRKNGTHSVWLLPRRWKKSAAWGRKSLPRIPQVVFMFNSAKVWKIVTTRIWAFGTVEYPQKWQSCSPFSGFLLALAVDTGIISISKSVQHSLLGHAVSSNSYTGNNLGSDKASVAIASHGFAFHDSWLWFISQSRITGVQCSTALMPISSKWGIFWIKPLKSETERQKRSPALCCGALFHLCHTKNTLHYELK